MQQETYVDSLTGKDYFLSRAAYAVVSLMRGVYPAWDYVVPRAPYRQLTSLVLVAASVGAIGSAEVVSSLVNVPRTATVSASVPARVTTDTAAGISTIVQDRPTNAQLPPSKIEQMPQPVPDLTASDQPAATAEAGGGIGLPDERRVQTDVPTGTHRRLYSRRFGRFVTPNHW